MHKVMIFLKRKPGMSLAAFRAYYEDHHVPLCMRHMAGAERYIRHYPDPVAGDAELPFDVITELWFKSAKVRDAVIERLNTDAMPADVIADELNLFDRSRSRAVAISECETAL